MMDIKRAWESFMLRLKNEATVTLRKNKSNGVCIVTANIVMDASGKPLAWVVLKGKRIEPSGTAKAVIETLIGGFGNE